MALDHDTCGRLLIKERVKLIGYIRAIVGHADTAEDVFQQLSVLVLNKHDDIESVDHFMGWMRRAARLESLSTLRKTKRAPRSLDDNVAQLLDPHWERYDAVESNVMIDALRSCLDELTPNARKLIEMRYQQEMTSSKIAKQLDRKPETVYQAISRAHQSLAVCIRKQTAPGTSESEGDHDA